MIKKWFVLMLIALIMMNNVNMPTVSGEEITETVRKSLTFDDPSKLIKNDTGFVYNSNIGNLDYTVKYDGMYTKGFTFASNGVLVQMVNGSPIYTLEISFSEEVDLHGLELYKVGAEEPAGRLIDFTTDTGKESIGNDFSSPFTFSDFQKIKKLTIKVYTTDNTDLNIQLGLSNIDVSFEQKPTNSSEISINTSEQQAINNYSFSNVQEGYSSVDIHEQTFSISKKSGNEINNITAEIDSDKFTLGNLSTATLNDQRTTTEFTIQPVEGLMEGTYTATVTIKADEIDPVTFTVQIQVTKTLESYKAIAAGLMHSLAIKNDGTVWSFGKNDEGQLGNGTKVDSAELIQVNKENGEPLKAVAIAAGTWHSLALDEDGNVWGWGGNAKGTLATGVSTAPKLFPVQAVGLPKITAISSTAGHALAIDIDNQVWVWGENSSKQLGNGTANPYSYFATPQKVKLVDGSELKGQAVEAGQNQSLVIDFDGNVWHWGTTEALSSIWPEQVKDSNNEILKGKQVTAGNSYFSVVNESGEVWTVGDNYFGQLGNGSTKNTTVTQAVKTTISDVKTLDAGYGHTIAIKNDGTVWGWGDNYLSSLGDLTNKDKNLPVQVKNFDGSFYTDASSVSAGGVHFTSATHTLSIKNGQLVTWGSNRYGQLGIPKSTTIKDYAELIIPTNVTVSFNTNGGTVIDPQTISYNTPVSMPEEPTKDNAVFLGWYEDPNNDPEYDDSYDFNSNVTSSITLYALWGKEEEERFTVSFDSQGGNPVSEITDITKDTVIQEPTEPTKEGHTFDGWYTDTDYATKYDFSAPVTENLTLFAKWNINEYNITFNTDGGTPIAPGLIEYNQSVTEPTAPARIGYEFEGWYTDTDDETKYDFSTPVTDNLTLFAKWKKSKYTITFESNKGSNIATQTIEHNNKVIKPNNPSRASYTFNGWFVDEQLKIAFNFEQPITGNITLYAKWTSVSTTTPDSSGPTTEEIMVDVVDDLNPNDLLVRTPFTRTRDNNSVKDNVVFSPEKAKESVLKLEGKEVKISRIVIPDTKDEVTETTINVPLASINELRNGQTSLSISTENVIITVPNTSLDTFNDNLYFHVVPVKKEQEKQVIETRAKQESKVKEVLKANQARVEVLGRPMTIETNMQNHPVTLTLPLPANVTQEQLDNLAIFIEHSDGTKEVLRGKIVDYKKGVKGVEFSISHFSTFTILHVEGAEEYFANQDKSCTEEKAIGCIQAKKIVPIYTMENNRLKKKSTLSKAQIKPVSEKISPMLGLGGNIWVERTDAILYETPAKEMLLKNEKANSERPIWKGLKMNPGQIGKITVLKDTVIWERINKTNKLPRILKKGEQYRVYRYVPALYKIQSEQYVEQQPKVLWISK